MFQSPTAANKTASYNNLNELTSLAGVPFSYDANGNLASDGQRNYVWDAENRLAAITYAAQPGKQTGFTYDGLGRRAAITTTSSGSAATTFQLWCGSRLCQSFNANGAPARSYYDEGEVDYASGTQLYYGPDRLGSVRDVAVAVSGASAAPQAYDYDPYGNPIQTTAGGALTDFRYAGMFYHPDSGLYLTRYRAYDPRTARWLSRDPVGERGAINLYAYVANNPINYIDPRGTGPIGAAIGAFIGALATSEGGPAAFVGALEGALAGSEIEDALFGDPSSPAPTDGQNSCPPGGDFPNGNPPDGSPQAGPPETSSPDFIATPPEPGRTPQLIQVPPGYETVPAEDGKGIVLRPQGQPLGDNRNIIRHGEPNEQNSQGYVRYYNSYGQPVDPTTGQPGSRTATHIPLDYQGPLLGYLGDNQQWNFMKTQMAGYLL